MRVICINNKPIPGCTNHPSHLKLIEEGNPYTVMNIVTDYKGHTGYILREVKINNPDGFDSRRFIECSELDELQLVNELVLVEK